MPDIKGSDEKEPGRREFMREKIVKPPLSKMQILKRMAAFLCLAALFGVIAAVSFVLSAPLAEQYLGKERQAESSSVMFSKDEPETVIPETSKVETTASEQGEKDMEETILEALSGYPFTMDNLASLYDLLREVSQQADKGIVTVRSGKQQTDLFGNLVENTGDYAGAVIAKTGGEYLIFTYADAVKQADSISVTFYDGTEAAGQSKQVDEVLNMAVVSVKAETVAADTREEVRVLPLGNSYSVKAGDLAIGVGGPSGMVHSTTYGVISYIARNVQMTDGITRILYADLHSNSDTGTFLMNMSGEIIGWASDGYRSEDKSHVTTAVSISDYKAVLEKMIKGLPAAYFGVKGQEVSEAMKEAGIPNGVYVIEAVAGSPAYDAGIQNGDIIVLYGEKEIATYKELQIQIENSVCGVSVPVKVMRKGREGYKELDYEVAIRSR